MLIMNEHKLLSLYEMHHVTDRHGVKEGGIEKLGNLIIFAFAQKRDAFVELRFVFYQSIHISARGYHRQDQRKKGRRG